MFSNGRDMTKCHNFCMTTTTLMTDNNNAMAIAIPRVFSENNQAKNFIELHPFCQPSTRRVAEGPPSNLSEILMRVMQA